jgi:cell cycle checkpoint protein
LNPQSDTISIYISPQAPYFRIGSDSPLGTIEIDVPRQSELMENFQCDYPQTFKYKYELMVPAIKGITASSKTSLRLNEQGCLSLQFMILTDEDQTSFVEYTVSNDDISLLIPRSERR